MRARVPMRSTLRLPFGRCLALLLLLSQGISLAHGLGPFVSGHCACEHGPDVPCDCPHHVRKKGQDPRPCHLHAKADRHSDAPKPAACSFRARCGSSPPALMLLAIASVPSLEEPQTEISAAPVAAVPILPHPSPVFLPPRPPPKARI